MTRRPPYQAHLRVYEPVATMPKDQRRRWTAYAANAPPPAEVEAQLYADTVRRLAGRPPVPVPVTESTHGLVIEQDGALYVCPLQPRLQVWTRLGAPDAPGELLPGEGVVPPALREQAASDLAAFTRSGGDVRLFSRTAAWHVPVSWFVPFAADERELTVGEHPSLRYRTAMSSARRRAAVGLRAARDGLGEIDVVDEIEQVARWMEDFHPLSLLELDYGGLATLLDAEHLTSDDSASDVAEGLAALSEGDATSAAAAYRRWTTRWHRVQLLSRAC